MTRSSALYGGAALGLVLACGAGAAEAAPRPAPETSPLERRVETLAAAVEALDRRLADETRAREASQAEASEARAAAAAARAETEAVRARLAQAAAPVETSPGTASAQVSAAGRPALRYKGVRLTPGGFIAAEGIYRSRNEVSDISSSFSKIPFRNAPLAHAHEWRATARQSRFSLLAQADPGPDVHVAAFGEIDLQGGAQTANSVESNSYNPRLRNAYATLDWDRWGVQVLAGQAWSLLTLNTRGVAPRSEAPPATIDGQFVPGFAWARQPQLRVAKAWGQSAWAAVSVENPQTTFAGAATGIGTTAAGVTVLTTAGAINGFDTGNNLSLNHRPDLIGKLAYEPRLWGGRPLHLELFGLSRSFETRVTLAPGNALGRPAGASNATAHGEAVGGSAVAGLFEGRLSLQGSVMTGRGIGRYGSAQLPDVTLRPDGTPVAIRETLALVGGTWRATPALDLYAFAGEERQSRRAYDAAGGHFGFGNPAASFTPAGCTTEGGVCTPNLRKVSQLAAGVWRKAYAGDFGQVRVGLQYSHTRLSGFSGAAGFAPRTSDDMVFTSLRYYLP